MDAVAGTMTVDMLSPTSKPIYCYTWVIIRPQDPIYDFLGTCLLWEFAYGDYAPTASPTTATPTTDAAALYYGYCRCVDVPERKCTQCTGEGEN